MIWRHTEYGGDKARKEKWEYQIMFPKIKSRSSKMDGVPGDSGLTES